MKDFNPKIMTNMKIKKKRETGFYLLIASAIFGLVIIGSLTIGVSKLKDVIVEYTETTPLELLTIAATVEEINALDNKFDSFINTIKKGIDTAYITLSEKDVNILINNHPAFQKLKGKVQISFENNKLAGTISIPINTFGLTFGKNQYLNGSAIFNISFNNRLLIVTINSFEIKGQGIPEELMNTVRNKNLAKKLYDDKEQAEILRRVKQLYIKDQSIVIEVLPDSD